MSVLPRSVPAAARAQLAAVLTAAHITLGDLKPGKRLTYPAAFAGTAWELTYLGPIGWGLTGPGVEHGIGVDPAGAAEHIAANSIPLLPLPKAPRSADGIPRTYCGVVVPALVRNVWAEPLADGWRLGVRSALAAR